MSFSCFDEPIVREHLNSLNRSIIILFGIEAHVCVMQTCIDLIENGYKPVIVEDCVSSRNINDKKISIERMRQEGALVTTYESLLFELTRFAGNEVFKRISGIVK
jgi:nicotinamidase-related amidase